MIMKKIIFVLFILPFNVIGQNPKSFSPAAFNDASRLERIKNAMPVIEKLYMDFAKANHVPGYAFGVVVDGQLTFKGAGGYANVEEKIPASTRSMFRIASMSKSFTSLAILHLRDAGKLTLDDPVEMYIPALKGQGLTTDAPAITIRHLMSHSAGFPEDNPWGDRQLADTEKDLNDLIKGQLSFSNVAGVEYEYSNLGFAMLGYIIHKVSGITYDAYIQQHILHPLGMNETTYEFTTIPKEKFAFGYRYINDEWRKETPLQDGIYGAMGGMITSIDMFGKYVAMHEAAWPERNDPESLPVKRSTLREMHQPARFISLNPNYTFPNGKKMATTGAYTYGLRWMIDADRKKNIGHSGGLPGYGSNWQFLPDYGIGVMLFANVTYAPTTAMNTAVLDTLVKMANLKPRQTSISPILAQRQQQLANVIVQWEGIPKIFAENFFDDYPIDQLKKQSATLFGQVGKIVKLNAMIAENQLRGYCIIACEKGNLKLAFTLSPENPALIQEYHLTKE
jgi:CubicO group peptidase (beta-lactamase class C family)